MNSLDDAIQRLLDLVRGQGLSAWTSIDLVFLEVPLDLDGDMRIRVPSDQIKPLDEARQEFERVFRRDYSWINLSCAGLRAGRLLLTVETPRQESPRGPETQRTAPSINISGMERRVVENGFGAGAAIIVVDP